MAEMLTVGDALAASLTRMLANYKGEEVPLAEREEHSGAGLDFAIERFKRRCHGIGMSEIMIQQQMEKSRGNYALAAGACESPIEKVLLPWLIFEDYGRIMGPASVHVENGYAELPDRDIVIIPQFKFLNYRMDFAVVVKVGRDRRIIVVECDGDEFHKNRREWDMHRDARLRSWGIETVRAEGKEAYSYPQAVSARVASIIIEWQQQA